MHNQKQFHPPFLTSRRISSLLTVKDVVACVEKAYRSVGLGRSVCPPKVSLELLGHSRGSVSWINSMPALLRDHGVAGVKWANLTFANGKRGLPKSMGLIILNDARTGAPLAVLDASWITWARTGSAVAVGAKYLARKGASVAAFLGAGAQASAALEALCSVIPLSQVRVFSRTGKTARTFARGAVVCPSAREAVRGADIVVVATTARSPVMRFSWARPGQLICGLSGMGDLETRFVSGSDKFLFDENRCGLERLRQAEGLRLKPGVLSPDICHIAARKAKGRANDREIITFIPVGLGAVDVAVALAAYRRAR